MAESTWEVTNENGSSNTFTIKRSEKGYEQTVHLRTISLSAYAGQHFTAVDMDYTFPANEDTKTVTVSESTPSGAFVYQTATSRKYGFEVTDRGGFQLAYAERSKTWGTSVTGSGVFSEKDVTIQTSEYTADDRGYDKNGYKSVGASSYCTSGTQAYLGFLGAQLRMTLSFDAKENDDAYEYLQILFGNTSTCDSRSGAGNGNPGTPSLSRYMAGFEMNTGAKDDTYRSYTFPVTSVGDDASATNPWGHGTDHPLTNQKFKSGYRATDGRLIVPVDFSSIVLRLNASGGSGSDEWAAKNVIAHIQAVDGTAPTKSAVSVNPGRHAKGNTVYVSVAFSEIVTVTGTPTLTTTSDNHWGSLSYVAGSGTNVLTFSTIIPQDATGNLNVTGLSGTVKDLSGNSLSGSVTVSNLCSLDDDLAYTLSDFQQEDGNYLITCHDDLRGLAGYVNSGNNCSGLTFRQVADIAFAHTTNWNNSSSTENNFTAIGDDDHRFQGTYDGDGHTISGIRIYKGGDKNSDNRQGLFGKVGRGGTVKRVTLADARITGRDYTGGIAGATLFCTIEDCTVEADVCIHAVRISTYYHGGIVGVNQDGPVRRCISRATLTEADASYCKNYGGIVGFNPNGTITDCIAEGVVIPDVKGRGAIVGYKSVGTLTRNYYRGCIVAGVANATGVGQGTSDSSTETSDVTTNQGALPLYAITLGTNVTINRTPATDPLPGTNNKTYTNGADIAGVPYSYEGATVALSYSGEVSTGYHVEYSATAGTISGSTLTMPAEAVTVSATFPANSYTVRFNKNNDVATGTMDDQAFTYDVAKDLYANTFTRTGYIFTGWNTEANGSGTSYTDGQEVLNLTATHCGIIELYAQWAVPYIAADGTEQLCTDYTVLSDATIPIDGSDWGEIGTDDQDTWYVATGSYTFSHDRLKAYGHVHLILMDDAVFNVNGNRYGILASNGIGDNLSIYGQRQGTGHLNASISAQSDGQGAIKVNLAIYGGTVSTTTVSGDGIWADGNVTINGGTVNATGAWDGIYALGNITINGGTVNATGALGGITADGNITLGWSDASDRITASSYGTRNGTIQVKAGQAFYDGADYYTGTLSTDQINAMAGKTLQPAVTYSITLPEHVSASGTVTRLNGTTYAPAGATVTLSTETGIILSSVTVNGTPATDNGDGTWSFIMPAQDVTVAATVTMPPVTYIDADGTEQSCTNYTLLTSYDDISNATNNQGYLPGGWYVVDGDIGFPYLQFSGDVHIILADGARLDAYDAIDCYGYDLTIYGQAAGSGELSVNTSIYCNNICINGGTINIENSYNYGIQAHGNVTINGGTINIENSNNASIQADGNVTINGGTLSFIHTDGIWASNVILASSTSLKTLNIIGDIYVNTISLDRTFTVGKPATLMLPFYKDVNIISGGTFYTFGGVEKENDRWVATMNAVTDYIEANTPYLVMPTETSLTFNLDTYLCTEGGGGGQTADEGSNWTFKGTYDYIKWTTDTSDPDYTAERAAEIGRVYGFAGVQKDGIEVGDFVKVASGARIRPMSAYLMWSNTPNAQNAPMRGSSRTGSAQELPQSITVRLLDASGTVTNVGEIDTVTGEISFEGWYTLQGVKLEAEPTEPGIYINNGKKVSIK